MDVGVTHQELPMEPVVEMEEVQVEKEALVVNQLKLVETLVVIAQMANTLERVVVEWGAWDFQAPQQMAEQERPI